MAPVRVTQTGEKTTVLFTDPASGTDYSSEEPTLVPHDDVFAVFDGVVDEAVHDEAVSDYGRHLVIEHRGFFTLYGHLDEVRVEEGERVKTGRNIGKMGQTSRIADARNWMAIAPHLHFEVWNPDRKPVDPVLFLNHGLTC
ncbi:MAG: M23 family metallopeptidase [Verrucomicrobiota bacterium]